VDDGEPRAGRAEVGRVVLMSEVRASALHKFVLALTFLFVVLALCLSSALVVYTAWIHDLQNGAFALAFAVLSAQIAMNWLRWKNEEDPAG
jgi:preprotein translocase subunit SecG